MVCRIRRTVWHAILWFGVACVFLGSCSFPGSVKPTVKIGLTAPFEGLYRDQGYEVLHAVRLAVRNRNEAGGVGGRYLVELVALNDFNEVEESRLQAGEMAADPGVLAVLGGWLPKTAKAAAPEYRRENLAFVAPGVDWADLGTEAARIMVREMGLHRATILFGKMPGDLALADAFGSALVEKGGRVIAEANPSDKGLTPRQVLASSEQPEVIFVAADASSAARWMAETREAGFDGVFIGGPKLGSSLVPDIAGQASEEAVFVSHYPPLSDDAGFVEGYRELSGGAPPGPEAEWAFATANRLLWAMEEVTLGLGEPSRAGVLEALAVEAGDELDVFVYMIRAGGVYASYLPEGRRSD
jgi:branched-chain amino acid transport system substrate-binding protein